jgi:hypothetical protein
VQRTLKLPAGPRFCNERRGAQGLSGRAPMKVMIASNTNQFVGVSDSIT